MKPILSVKMSSKSKLLPFDLNKKKKIKKQRGAGVYFGWRDEERWERKGSGEIEERERLKSDGMG